MFMRQEDNCDERVRRAIGERIDGDRFKIDSMDLMHPQAIERKFA